MLKETARRIAAPAFGAGGVPILLLLITLLVYGLFFWQMGFYWDDLPISWIRYQFGSEISRLYFSTNRPVWGELYQLTTRFLPQVPAVWQVFALLWRWLGAVILWQIVRILWPGRVQLPIVVTALFLLYPGFNMQWVAFLSSHFYIVLFIFLASHLVMLWSFQQPKWYWPLTALGVTLSGLNLWMLEYFFGLELLRPFLIYFFILQASSSTAPRVPVKYLIETVKRWLPYLLVFVANVFYRMFVFSNLAYENVLLTKLRADPVAASIGLVREVILDLWIVFVQAWAMIFELPDPAAQGWRTILFYLAIVLIIGFLIILFLARGEGLDRRAARWAIGLGLAAMIVGGAPYWLAALEVTLRFPANRFSLSFMLGASLLLAGLLELLPSKFRLAAVTVLIALAAGRQALWVETFRRDWATHRNMFWQMTWRAPALRPNTVVLMNEGALAYYADNSLAAALNWIYAPESDSERIPLAFFYPRSRLGGTLPALEPDVPIEYTYLVGGFSGNTSQTVAFYFQPPGCLRLLDMEIDPLNRLIPADSLMREAAQLSSTTPILPAPAARLPGIYGPEPEHDWCYHFAKADLARQLADWEKVAALGDSAFELDDHPNDPVERFVFIEGYAHVGNWERAVELSRESYRVSREILRPMLCALWDRIGTQTVDSPEKQAALSDIQEMLSCPG